MDKLTFHYAVNADGSVTYKADADGAIQNLSGRDTSSTEALEADLAAYTQAYVGGLSQGETSMGSDISVGAAKSADAKAILEA